MKQETRGRVTKLKGRMKEAVGAITGDRKLQRAGAQQRTVGAAQESVGRAHRKLGELAHEFAKTMKKK